MKNSSTFHIGLTRRSDVSLGLSLDLAMAAKNATLDPNKVVFVKRLERGYLCNLCGLVLQTPYQTKCGHRFCEGCIKGLLTS